MPQEFVPFSFSVPLPFLSLCVNTPVITRAEGMINSSKTDIGRDLSSSDSESLSPNVMFLLTETYIFVMRYGDSARVAFDRTEI